METKIAKLVCFGKGGDSVEFSGKGSLSGYGSWERPHAARPGVHGDYLLEIPDGTPVVDVSTAVEYQVGVSWSLRGPMVDVDLPDNARVDCPEPSDALRLGLDGEFRALLGLQDIHRRGGHRSQAGPLDYVSTAEYVRGWKEHGAAVGHYEHGVIVWDHAPALPSGVPKVPAVKLNQIPLFN